MFVVLFNMVKGNVYMGCESVVNIGNMLNIYILSLNFFVVIVGF